METHCFPGNCLVCPFHGSRLAGSIELLDPADPCPVTDKGATACERSGGEQGGQAGIRESRMPCCPERFRFSDGVAPRPATTGHRVLPPFPADRGPWIPCETLIPDDPNCLLLRRANDGASSHLNRQRWAPIFVWSFEGCGPAASATNHTATSHAWCLARLKPRGGPKVQRS